MFNLNQGDWLKSVQDILRNRYQLKFGLKLDLKSNRKLILRWIPPPGVSEWDINILSVSYGQRLTKCIHEDSWGFVHNVKLQEDFESRKFVSRHTDLYSTGCQGL